jgi:ribonuclease BN (tRNA processing enzyme)
MKLTILGSGGWIPTEKRQTCTYFIEIEDNLIFMDTGTGMSRLYDYASIFDKYNTINIIYSHYHLDHVIGLIYLPNWIKHHRVRIWGPGRLYYGKSCRETLSSMISSPFFALPLDEFSKEVEIHDYDSNGFNLNDNIDILINAQKHTDPSFGITIGNYVHYATDTNVIESTFQRSEHVKYLLHECWDIQYDVKTEHSALSEILQMVRKYSINNFGLIHVNPNWSKDDETNVSLSLKKFTNAKLLNDGDVINL